MGFELAEIVTELGEGIVWGGKLEGRKDGLMDLSGAPSAELGTAVEQDFHEAEHAGVLDFDARDFAVSRGNGKSQTLEEGEVDVDIQGLGFELGKMVGDGGEGPTDGFQVIQGFFQSEVFQVIAEDLQAQEGGKLFIHAQHGVFGAGAQHMMAMVHPLQDSGELTSDPLVETKAEHLRELVSSKAEQAEVTGALEEFVNGEVPSEDEVAAVFDWRQGVRASEVEGGSVFRGKLRPYHPSPVIELLANDLGVETVGCGLEGLGIGHPEESIVILAELDA